jgi:hypothetical protein
MLTRIVIAILPLVVLAQRVRAQPADCDKDVFLYFDVSASMHEKYEEVSRIELFTLAVRGLLKRENFVSPADRIVVVAFAQTATTLLDRTNAAAAAASVIQELEQPERVGSSGVGDRNHTNLAAVLSHMKRHHEPGRQQVFVIASDFNHDPENDNCAQTRARKLHFRTAAESLHDEIGGAKLKLALLVAEAADKCPDDEGNKDNSVANVVLNTFRDVLDVKRHVAVSENESRIVNLLRQVIGDPVLLDEDSASAMDGKITVTARNSNPFPITIQELKLSGPNGTHPHITKPRTIIGCGQSESLQSDIPPSLINEPALTVTVQATTPPADPLAIPSNPVTINTPETHIFKDVLNATYAIELHVKKTANRNLMFEVSGVPGAHAERFPVDATRGPTTVAMVIHGDRDATKAVVQVRLVEGDLRVAQREGSREVVTGVGQGGTVEAIAGQPHGENVPWITQVLSLIIIAGVALRYLKVIPVSVRQWLNLFDDVSDAKDIVIGAHAGIKLLIGGSVVGFPWVIPYRPIPFEITIGNACWAFVATCLTLFICRWAIILVLWRMIEWRLLPTPRAVALRLVLVLFCVVLALGTGWYVFGSLQLAISDAMVLAPESAS